LLHQNFRSVDLVRPAWHLAAVPVLVAGLFSVLLFAASFYSLGRGGDQRVAQAFAAGALDDRNFHRGDAISGYNQFNDCLIIAMALDQRAPRRQLAISPTVPFAHDADVCLALHRGTRNTAVFYHNYLHGPTVLARYLLPLLPVAQLRELYRLTLTLLLAGAIAVALRRLAGPADGRTRESAVLLIVLLTFARGFGLEVFGQSLSHGPSDTIVAGFLAFAVTAGPTLTPPRAVVAAAVFGALTMIFEFMTGGAPVGLAIVIGLTWFMLRPSDRRVRHVAQAAGSFVLSCATCAALKVAAVAAVFGPAALADIAHRGAVRVAGGLPPALAGRWTVQAVAGSSEALMPGLGSLAALLVILAAGFGARAALQLRTSEAKLLLWSNLPIVVWFAVFRQHTIMHAWFMDRMLAWTIASGFALVFLAAADRRPTSATCAAAH
jgi:hypothetical protein